MVVLNWIRLFVLFAAAGSVAGFAAPGDDVVAAFSRAAKGEPLRYVAIGGSITEASGPGWAGEWLRETFPEGRMVAINSGISGTGSSLGVFRIERDVIAHQPDLVAIEYCVNDGGLTDEEAIRYVESMIVRLKSLPRPPAIVILESAARTGVNLSRHRRLARHYDLLEVDFQAAVDAKLRDEGRAWTDFFNDDVHPNRAGHALYAATMRAALEPLAIRARAAAASFGKVEARVLPAPISDKPLILDGRLVPLQGRREASGDWRSETAPAVGWGRFFQGMLVAERPGAALQIPFLGTIAGLFIPVRKDQGSFLMNVDGRMPAQVFPNNRDGFTSVLAETDLAPGEHVLNVVLPSVASNDPDFKTQGPVRLGYLLVGGESRAADGSAAADGRFDVDALRALAFDTMAAKAWRWTGPFAVPARADGRPAVDAGAAIATSFLPELERAPDAADAVAWRSIEAGGGVVDFRALIGDTAPAVAYARGEWNSETGGETVLWAEIDYYAQLWLNGERVLSLDGPHRVPVFVPVKLRAGKNTLLLKAGAGSAGFSARLRFAPLDKS